MAVSKKSPYDVLGIQPFATIGEVDRAYRARRNRLVLARDDSRLDAVERAYQTLADPTLKRLCNRLIERNRYDRSPVPASAGAEPETAAAGSRGRLRIVVLGALLAILVVVLLLCVGPLVLPGVRTYEVGRELVSRDAGAAFGTVIDYQPDHRFPGGVVADAYHVRLQPANEERWLSRQEVNLLARPR